MQHRRLDDAREDVHELLKGPHRHPPGGEQLQENLDRRRRQDVPQDTMQAADQDATPLKGESSTMQSWMLNSTGLPPKTGNEPLHTTNLSKKNVKRWGSRGATKRLHEGGQQLEPRPLVPRHCGGVVRHLRGGRLRGNDQHRCCGDRRLVKVPGSQMSEVQLCSCGGRTMRRCAPQMRGGMRARAFAEASPTKATMPHAAAAPASVSPMRECPKRP